MTNYAPCPKCSTAAAEPVKFTWWGGVLGPKLLTHVKCSNCGSKYNGKSGKDNTKGIVVYSLVIAILAFGLMFVLFAGLAIFSVMK
jgi:hypothetical protein